MCDRAVAEQADERPTMVLKLAFEAENTWRRLMSFRLIPLLMEWAEYVDGELTETKCCGS